MSTKKAIVRRAPRRIGVEERADFAGRREIVLREAARAFNENGIQNTSMEDVAARLNVTKPALYRYVSSKDEIIGQCLALALLADRQLLADAADLPGTGLDKFRYVSRRWLKDVVSDFGRSIVVVDVRTLTPKCLRQQRKVVDQMKRGIKSIIQEGISDGSIRTCDTTIVTLSLIGLLNSTALWYRHEGPLDIDQIATELIALMEQGVAEGTSRNLR